MDYFILSLNFFILGFLAWRYWKSDDSLFRKFYWPLLFLKLSAGLLLGYVYSFYYTDSDTVRFFESSIELTGLAHHDAGAYFHYLWSETEAPYSGENRTLFFVKLVSLFALVTNNNYWIVSLYFSLLSFFCAWWLTRVISHYFPKRMGAVVFAFLVFPSSVFWSSGVIKETAAMMALYFLAGIYVRLWMKDRVPFWQWLMTGASLWMLWSLKYYYAAVFIPVACTAWLTRWLVENRLRSTAYIAYREFVLFAVLLMVMFFVVTFVHPNFYPQRILEVIVENYNIFINVSHPDKVIHFYKLEGTLSSIMLNAPWAFLSGLFRPFIWEASNIFQVLVSVENLFLVSLTVLSLRNVRTMGKSDHRILFFALLAYSFLLCVFLTLSVPNFGSLVRYRIGFLPFFVLLVSSSPGVADLLQQPFKTKDPGL